jgi:tartrate dehydratase beta subunit/fumarate hydratase class I family protein
MAMSLKQAQLSWAAVSGATHYRVWQRPDSSTAFSQVGADQTGTSARLALALHKQVNASYRVQACNADGCSDSNIVTVASQLTQAVGYVKASNTGASDEFGYSVALSADGNTLAVGASGEDSNAMGVNGNQANNSASDSGAVYVFARTGSTWTQQAYVKASNTGADDQFGYSVALSADGNTLAVGAYLEDSNALDVDGDQTNNSASDSGAVYVFTRSNASWTQQAYVKASNTETYDQFGYSVALSADGNTLAVGAYREDSNATGVNGVETNNSADYSGAVYVLTRTGSTWTQQAYVKASNTGVNDQFGYSVALSADGNTLAVGAIHEDSNALGIDAPGGQTNNSVTESGAVYVFARTGSTWAQQAYVKASNTETYDRFGWSVALSADGNTLAVGAMYEDSNATGVNGGQANNSASESGAVYVFARTGSTWAQQAYVKASNTGAYDLFGYSVALSADGNTLAVGAVYDDSNATGVNGDQTDNSEQDSGAVYVFARTGSTWAQQAYVKASNTGTYDTFGRSVALSADGNTLAVGGAGERSNATGVNGDQTNNSALGSGAVYLY